MTRVIGFTLGAVFAAGCAYLARESGGLPFWLYVFGAAGFTLAAVLQLLGEKRAS